MHTTSTVSPYMPEQLNLFSAFEQLLITDALAIFHDIEGKLKSPSYKSQYKPVIDFFPNRYIHTFTDIDIKNYRQHRELDGMMYSTVNREHSMITRMFNAFKKWKGIGVVSGYNFSKLQLPPENPGQLVRKPDESPLARTLVLTPMEFFRYCDFAHPNIRVIVILAVLTLLRRKNLEILHKDNFNAALKQIQVIQSKTKIPVAIPATQTVSLIINESKYDVICDFTNFRKLHERARRESGVYFWMTDLRRTGATQMLLDGIDLRTIQKYLGQTTLVMTERYLQPPAQHLIDAAHKVETRFGSAIEMAGFSTIKK